ncbi:TMEM175 family protein [Methanofollis sp. UBA420]|jgi:uncharacterized membrane protein|uniref:TMEM175 family protein n=1 Tax=Methanofollis sp. UBA420 TaxID=1915514 RepID=UPI00316AD53D
MQTAETSPSEGIGFSKARFEALTDGIFAFAMTLLVVGMAVPAATTATTSAGVTWSTAVYLLIPPLLWTFRRI